MTTTIVLNPTPCAICGTTGNSAELYRANFSPEAFNPCVFSARRLPDRIHYRMVRCMTCGLVRSDPAADPEALAVLYKQSSFDYGSEVASLKQTYGHYLSKLARYGGNSGSLLEIGCGNGFFLEEALTMGYKNVIGIEPSNAAATVAAESVRSNIVCDIMRPGIFEPEKFNVVCMFQVFDHLSSPREVLQECFRVLKPGGLLLCLNHNVDSVSAKILGERSPIIDIEHTYLFGPGTISRILESHGFLVRVVGAVFNRYSLYYLARLAPLPGGLKRGMLKCLDALKTRRLQLSVPLGNMYVIAQKHHQ